MKPILASLALTFALGTLTAAEPAILENRALRVELAPDTGRIRIIEKTSGQVWTQPTNTAATAYRVARQTKAVLEVERTIDAGKGRKFPLKLRFSLPDAKAADLRVEATIDDPNTAISDLRVLEPFVLDAPHGVLAVADYSNGHLYPLDMQPFPRGGFGGDRLDMPWLGLCDLDTGRGCMVLIETCDDSRVSMQKVAGKDGRALVAPLVIWLPQKGVFGYPRSLLYHFAPSGGYVALCKRYREYAREHGLLVPFTEKLKKNPNLRRLFGAPDVWGNASLSFAREAKAAGVEKMLVHGRPASPADMRAINELGYLTSEYDNYTDILPAKDGKIDSSHAILPDDAVLKNDNQRMTAWLTWDKKTQYMKRCPTLWAAAAKNTADRVLSEWPFVGRFIDVTTAESLYECFDPKHSMTRAQKRECGPALHRVFRDRKLVMGGEHGIWWCVPWVDYIEGMQSGGYASWPAGHLIHPKTKDEEFEGAWGKLRTKWADYAKWGIGHEWRAPLWELVFHDCIVSTWYWGDASDWLLDAAPEITAKKDAFNVLYGNIPLLWANAGSSWVKDRAVFLRTYRNTCKLHEAIATAELVSHEFVTPDHAVQRTRFSDGTECFVNFGEKPFRGAVGGREYVLPQNGWAVKGPKIEQSLALANGRSITTIRTEGYAFADESDAPVTMSADGTGRMRIIVEKAARRVSVRPEGVAARWKADGAILYRLDAHGRPVDVVASQTGSTGDLVFGPVTQPAAFLLLWGKGLQQPDLRVSDLQLTSQSLKQGETLRVTATIENAGGASASRVPVNFLIDGRVVRSEEVSIKGGQRAFAVAIVDTTPMDGERRLAVVIDPSGKLAEISKLNNQTERSLSVTPTWSQWPNRKTLRVAAGNVARKDEPVVVPFKLPPGADTNSVRVAELDAQGNIARSLPAQLDSGELALILPGTLNANAIRKLMVLWRDSSTKGPGLFPPGPSFWHDAQQAIIAPGYEARFEDGTLTFLAARKDGVTGKQFLKSLILSSSETGWSDEPGKIEQFQMEHTGPVRTVIRVRKALKAGVVYEKRYTFYPHRIDLEITVNKPAGGLYSRAHYLDKCTYLDDKGNRATVDGKGDAEDTYGKDKNPKWYAVFSEDWAHSCIALSRFDHIAYWDTGGGWGSIGLTTGELKNIRLSYVVHPGAKDATFAGEDYRRLTTPVTVTWE